MSGGAPHPPPRHLPNRPQLSPCGLVLPELLASLMEGVKNRLDSSLPPVRRLGMIVVLILKYSMSHLICVKLDYFLLWELNKDKNIKFKRLLLQRVFF